MSRCRLVSSRYKICLEEEAKQKQITEKEKRKLDLRDELRNNVEKRRKMEKSVERIVREADELSLKAAAEKDFAFLEKSNAKRQQAIQMKSEIEKTTESVSKLRRKSKSYK